MNKADNIKGIFLSLVLGVFLYLFRDEIRITSYIIPTIILLVIFIIVMTIYYFLEENRYQQKLLNNGRYEEVIKYTISRALS